MLVSEAKVQGSLLGKSGCVCVCVCGEGVLMLGIPIDAN